MGHNWIIDVLADLESYAHQNDLPMLADQIEQAALVATAEVASLAEGAPMMVLGNDNKVRTVPAGS